MHHSIRDAHATAATTAATTVPLRRRFRRGFTMVELIAVVMVIAIMAAVSIQAFGEKSYSAKEALLKRDVAIGVSMALSYWSRNGNNVNSIDTTSSAANWQGTKGNHDSYGNVTADSIDVRVSNAEINRKCYRKLNTTQNVSQLICTAGVWP